MLRPLIALMVALILAACNGIGQGDASITLTVDGRSPGIEGSVIFVHVDHSSERIDWADYTAPIPSGHHFVSVDTATCDGNCGNLDPAFEQCSNTVDVPVGGTVVIEIVGRDLAPGTSCEISVQ